MKQLTFILTLLLAVVYGYGQEPMIKNIPLPFETRTNGVNTIGSRMTLENETLYVPTTNGIWSININTPEGGWTLSRIRGRKSNGVYSLRR